jgi:hypothetical protein
VPSTCVNARGHHARLPLLADCLPGSARLAMNVLKMLLLVAGVVASVVVFLLMRYPGMRREQFRQGRAFSMRSSALGALAVLAVFSLIASLQ